MQKHTKVYFEYFGYTDQNQVECEVCKSKGISKLAVDIHHIEPRSKFGKKRKHLQDKIENLIGVCREDHDRAEGKIEPKLSKEELQDIHNQNL